MKFFLVLLCAAILQAAILGPAAAYPENYLSGKLGASVSTSAKLEGKGDPNAILSDGPISRGGFSFARVEQPQVFTVDLGRERTFDRVDFSTGNAGDDRNAKRVRIEVSRKGPDGPFEKVFEETDLGFFQILRLPLVKARWVRFDLGEGAEGARVHNVRLYKGYEHPRLTEVTRLLHERIKPGLPGLDKFYAAADKGDWKKACAALRAYYATKHKPDGPPNPAKYDLSRAEGLAAGKLDFAGLPRVDTVPIDWSYMKTTDWYEHKNFLNRGSPLGVPVDAYYHTGDKKWAERFRSVFYDWVDANPKPTVMSSADYPTWRTLDTAARAGWLNSRFPQVTVGKDIEDELWANYLFSIWEQADYLKNDDFTGGNWLATVTGSVMDAALKFPEFRDQKIWLAYGKDGFERNVLRDVHPDGKEMEDAPGYVCMAYNGMLGTLRALDEAGIKVNPETRQRLNKTQDFLAAVTQPDGNMPAIGDWGGGSAYALPAALEYFKREDIKYVMTNGKEGKMPALASVNFPYGGWSVMRSAYDEQPYENARHLVFKTSSGAHGHDDILNITAYAYGRELLIDPAIRSYEHADVILYPQTAYHNTVCVDGKNQSRGSGKTEKWVSNAGLDYVLGKHTAYKGLTHRRDIVFIKPEYWIVHDDISGEGEHTYDQNWHFAEDAGITEDPATKAVHTSYSTGGNLLMVPLDPDSLESESVDFLIARSRMGSTGSVQSKGWKYSRSGPAPQAFGLVLYPHMGTEAPKVSVKRLAIEADSTDVIALQIDIGTSTDYVIISRSGLKTVSVSEGNIEVDGEVVVIRTKAGKAIRVSGANVKNLSFGGKTLFSQEQPAADVDVMLQR